MMTASHAVSTTPLPPSPTNATSSSPMGEEMNPITVALNCMNGEVKQDNISR